MKNYDLDTPLITLSKNQSEKKNWTVRNAVEGVQIFGGIGSGKTTGSARMIALKFLAAGFGGLVLTVKPTEKNDWDEYCNLTGRKDDLLIVEPGRDNYFNFLNYVSQGDGMTENIVEVLKTVIRASEEKASGGSDDPFWETALDMLIFNVIDLCKLAYGKVSVQVMFDIVQSLPKPNSVSKTDKKENAFNNAFIQAQINVAEKIKNWEETQTDKPFLNRKNEFEYEEIVCNAVSEARAFKFIDQFFLETFMNLSEKTRSVIDFSFSGFLFRLLRDPVYSLFCRHEYNFTPESCLDGKIILINFPVKVYHKVGRDIQIMFKYIWQRAMEKRDISDNGRPVFLWADEAQNFLHEHDPDYQATARSSRIATVYISQNLPNYHANMGGDKSEFKVKSFLGTLNTKIFHANADVETNRYASELFGDGYFEDTSRTATASGHFSASQTKSLKIDRLVRPEAFVQLKTGGDLNKNKVEGYLHLQGNPIKDGQNHVKIQFDQGFDPNSVNNQ